MVEVLLLMASLALAALVPILLALVLISRRKTGKKIPEQRYERNREG